jgi:hypothetical protein
MQALPQGLPFLQLGCPPEADEGPAIASAPPPFEAVVALALFEAEGLDEEQAVNLPAEFRHCCLAWADGDRARASTAARAIERIDRCLMV